MSLIEKSDYELAVNYRGPLDNTYERSEIINLTGQQINEFAQLFNYNPNIYTREQNIQKILNVLTYLNLIHATPACQLRVDPRPDAGRVRCQGVLIDAYKRILIVYENSYPIELRRWGLPKGKFKVGEEILECVTREVCEEVGIYLEKYPAQISKIGNNLFVKFDIPAEQIRLHLGPEIIDAIWIDVKELKQKVRMDIMATKRNPEHKRIYNMLLKDVIFKI